MCACLCARLAKALTGFKKVSTQCTNTCDVSSIMRYTLSPPLSCTRTASMRELLLLLLFYFFICYPTCWGPFAVLRLPYTAADNRTTSNTSHTKQPSSTSQGGRGQRGKRGESSLTITRMDDEREAMQCVCVCVCCSFPHCFTDPHHTLRVMRRCVHTPHTGAYRFGRTSFDVPRSASTANMLPSHCEAGDPHIGKWGKKKAILYASFAVFFFF
jgi:hypothetical protein